MCAKYIFNQYNQVNDVNIICLLFLIISFHFLLPTKPITKRLLRVIHIMYSSKAKSLYCIIVFFSILITNTIENEVKQMENRKTRTICYNFCLKQPNCVLIIHERYKKCQNYYSEKMNFLYFFVKVLKKTKKPNPRPKKT